MLAVLAVTALGINCTELIRPRDPSPIRSPQNIHSWLSERFAGLEIVEIGTRNGDGMACFAQTARAAIAVEIDRHYCEILRKRAARLAQRGSGNFTVVCQDYRKAHLDGDIFTWWEQAPFLTNHVAIQHLRRELQAGRIRKSAQAVVLFDMSWQDDVDSLKQLITQARRGRTHTHTGVSAGGRRVLSRRRRGPRTSSTTRRRCVEGSRSRRGRRGGWSDRGRPHRPEQEPACCLPPRRRPLPPRPDRRAPPQPLGGVHWPQQLGSGRAQGPAFPPAGGKAAQRLERELSTGQGPLRRRGHPTRPPAPAASQTVGEQAVSGELISRLEPMTGERGDTHTVRLHVQRSHSALVRVVAVFILCETAQFTTTTRGRLWSRPHSYFSFLERTTASGGSILLWGGKCRGSCAWAQA